MSNEKKNWWFFRVYLENLVYLFYMQLWLVLGVKLMEINVATCFPGIGDEILPSYVGIIINHKDPYCWWLKSQTTTWDGAKNR